MQQESRNRDMRNRDSITFVESRSDLDHQIIGHVASDRNFVDLGSMEHSVEIYEMGKHKRALCISTWS
jgi:hypothetical protein